MYRQFFFRFIEKLLGIEKIFRLQLMYHRLNNPCLSSYNNNNVNNFDYSY